MASILRKLSNPLGLAVITTVAVWPTLFLLYPTRNIWNCLSSRCFVCLHQRNCRVALSTWFLILVRCFRLNQLECQDFPRKLLICKGRNSSDCRFDYLRSFNHWSNGLETEFDLTDFLDDEMEIMEVREDLDKP